jgi:hypothetical protein
LKTSEFVQFAGASAGQALARHATQRALGNIEPTAMLGGENEVNAFYVRTSDFWLGVSVFKDRK